VGHLLEQLALCYDRMPQEFEEHPVGVFHRNVYVNPFWEDDVARLIDLITVEHVLFGSDYPHPEGLAEPLDYLDHLAEYPTIDDAAKRRIMSENANDLLGLSMAA
jgi:predicted TIM-barrel fold metal-dependent hydrolase